MMTLHYDPYQHLDQQEVGKSYSFVHLLCNAHIYVDKMPPTPPSHILLLDFMDILVLESYTSPEASEYKHAFSISTPIEGSTRTCLIKDKSPILVGIMYLHAR